MAIAEGKTLPFKDPKTVDTSILETFPYQGPNQWIRYTTNEFSAVCPFSGLPDFATVVVEYIPDQYCVELKSLKYYYLSYRDVGIFQEDMTAKVYQDLAQLLKPKEFKLTVTYQTRGGIDTVTSIDSKDQ
ncbi:MAG: NADPH-dependent 7-cyano-7-deazaguanine reductase QueF [Bdellovibrionales bacterium]|nr:NADPH-dependent 7-cyano-7-deazaguanine reductase QueF [Bdellovibrionales bacterium]